MLTFKWKRSQPRISEAKIKKAKDIFGRDIQEEIVKINSQKNSLKFNYNSQTQKFLPGCCSASRDLKHFQTIEDYRKYTGLQVEKNITKKQLKLGVWIPDSFPLHLSNFIRVMEYLSFCNDTGKIIYDFLNSSNIQKLLVNFPTRIQVPINFTLFLEIEVTNVSKQILTNYEFDYTNVFKKVSRQQYQKTLERREKRSIISKLYY